MDPALEYLLYHRREMLSTLEGIVRLESPSFEKQAADRCVAMPAVGRERLPRNNQSSQEIAPLQTGRPV